MRKPLLATAAAIAVLAGLPALAPAQDGPIKLGILLGFTGPIESLTPDMASGAEMALKEVTDSGLLLGGAAIEGVRADSTCTDAAAATAAAERLITSDGVAAIMGADCSGVTTAVANNVAVPNGVVMISPSATSPALSTIEDNGFFFRTAPSDARQGEVLANIVKERGYDNVAITYTNNDYGKGLTESFGGAFEAGGGSIAITAAHEDGKADYSAEVAALAASGAPVLVVFGYVDQGGKGIIQNSLDTGAFDTFIFADGMVGDALTAEMSTEIDGSFGTAPGSDFEGAGLFLGLAEAAGFDGDGPFRGESYDGAALIALAIQKAGSADRAAIQGAIMDVANAPGEPIMAGELAKGLEILAAGGDIDYIGATAVEFNEVGEAAGSYKEIELQDGEFATVGVH